jgi:hypothetical protein
MDRVGAAEVEAMIDAEFARETPARKSGRVILVDGFNVLHAVLLGKEREDGWWRRASRERLLRRVSRWQDGPDEIWVAFDGTQPAWSMWAESILIPETSASNSTTVHSVFVESADDWIVRRARRATHPEHTIIVSGDRKVSGRARSAGCEIWTPWTLISRCPKSDEPDESEDGALISDASPIPH